MDARGETSEPRDGEPATRAQGPGARLWTLRAFILTLLLAGVVAVAVVAVTIVSDTGSPAKARLVEFGVLMPDSTAYRVQASQLRARKPPQLLLGVTVAGADGKVTFLKATHEGRTTFPSTYLNPGALPLIARSIGLRSDAQITVAELRLEKLMGTGRLRWRLRGRLDGRPWRAVIAPNGTGLRLLPTG